LIVVAIVTSGRFRVDRARSKTDDLFRAARTLALQAPVSNAI
jgi:hypothetical protein